MTQTLEQLLARIRACRHCAAHLPLGPRPVIRGTTSARLLIIGQAPGTRVHASGIPWDDASGARLRQWLQMTPEQFYDETRVAIMPMGLCYPGRGRQGDNPPRPECAPLWHESVLAHLPDLSLILLVGQYAQRYYLGDRQSLTQRVLQPERYGPRFWPLPHPSPRNQLWLKRNPMFEQQIVPRLRQRLAELAQTTPL